MSTVVNLSSLLFESPIENVRLSLDEAKETIVQEVLGNLELEGIRLERDNQAGEHKLVYYITKPVPFIILASADNIIEQFDAKLELRFVSFEQYQHSDRLFQIYMRMEKQNENILYGDDIEATFMDFWDNLITSTQYTEHYLANPSKLIKTNILVRDPEDIISALTNHAINLYNKWFRQTGEIVVNESGRMIE